MPLLGFFNKAPQKNQKQPAKNRNEQEAPEIKLTVLDSSGRGNGTLNAAFNKRLPSESEKKLFKETLGILSSVPQGKKLLNEVAEMGFEVFFNNGLNALGSMCGSQKKIMINPELHSNPASMAVTLVHEMTHVMQNERSKQLLQDVSRLNIADAIKFNRACEAAAFTEQANFAWQIKDRHPEAVKEIKDFPMWHIFSYKMKRSGDISDAAKSCFRTWYSYPHYQRRYEKQFLNNLETALRFRSKHNDNKAFRESLSAKEILTCAFQTETLKKNVPERFLSSKEAFSLSPETKQTIDDQVQKYASAILFRKVVKDTSHHAMYSYKTGKTFKSVSAASLTALRNSNDR